MNTKTLAASLKKVHLVYSSQHIHKHLSLAESENLSYAQFIEHLLEEEINHRRQRRIAGRLRQSKLKVRKTLENFDFSFPDKIDAKLVKTLFDLRLINENKNVILIGPPGVGKTHIASALCYYACLNDYKCRFTTAMNLINELTASLSDNSFLTLMKRYASLDLLIIDELGYLPVEKQGADLLFQIISNRYETGSVVITTNRPFADWGKVFNNDTTLAGAMIDRLAHHRIIIEIEGPSYRVNSK